jgi:hypothetical protein
MCLKLYKLCFSVFLLLPFTAQSADRIFKWVDAQGQTHYGSRVMMPENSAGVEVTRIKPNVIKSIPVPSGSQKKSRSARSQEVKAIPAHDQVDKRTLRCEKARNNLKKVRARLRAGYKYNQYSRLHAREAKYRAQRSAYCP